MTTFYFTTTNNEVISTSIIYSPLNVWRGTLINGAPLLQPLSSDTVSRQGRTLEDLLPNQYTHLDEDIGIWVPYPVELRIGPSCIPEAGLGAFIYTDSVTLLPGTVLGIFWGSDTYNGGSHRSMHQWTLLSRLEHGMEAHIYCVIEHISWKRLQNVLWDMQTKVGWRLTVSSSI